MGQQPGCATMNSASSGKSSTRSSGYHQKALAEIRNSLLPFANIGSENSGVGSSAASTISTLSTTSGVSSASGLSSTSNSNSNGIGVDKELNSALRHNLTQLTSMGYTEVGCFVEENSYKLTCRATSIDYLVRLAYGLVISTKEVLIVII